MDALIRQLQNANGSLSLYLSLCPYLCLSNSLSLLQHKWIAMGDVLAWSKLSPIVLPFYFHCSFIWKTCSSFECKSTERFTSKVRNISSTSICSACTHWTWFFLVMNLCCYATKNLFQNFVRVSKFQYFYYNS